jgi:ribonuclease HII
MGRRGSPGEAARSVPIAGLDEAGRGCLAGPVVAAAVVLPATGLPAGLRDSKRIRPAERERLYRAILASAVAVGVGVAEAQAIDAGNILWATLRAMCDAVDALPVRPGLVLADGNQPPPLAIPCRAIPHGDAEIPVISAASIVAKVTRDRLMRSYEARFPGYGFAGHKGYGTPAHLAVLRRLGPSPIHRRTFAPVARIAAQGEGWPAPELAGDGR